MWVNFNPSHTHTAHTYIQFAILNFLPQKLGAQLHSVQPCPPFFASARLFFCQASFPRFPRPCCSISSTYTCWRDIKRAKSAGDKVDMAQRNVMALNRLCVCVINNRFLVLLLAFFFLLYQKEEQEIKKPQHF